MASLKEVKNRISSVQEYASDNFSDEDGGFCQAAQGAGSGLRICCLIRRKLNEILTNFLSADASGRVSLYRVERPGRAGGYCGVFVQFSSLCGAFNANVAEDAGAARWENIDRVGHKRIS